jgi:hypothetical protein
MGTKEGLDMTTSNGSTLNIDNTLMFGIGIEHDVVVFLLFQYVCLISCKYHVTHVEIDESPMATIQNRIHWS